MTQKIVNITLLGQAVQLSCTEEEEPLLNAAVARIHRLDEAQLGKRGGSDTLRHLLNLVLLLGVAYERSLLEQSAQQKELLLRLDQLLAESGSLLKQLVPGAVSSPSA